jgi:O-antigen/teichoic acid export membrane protein
MINKIKYIANKIGIDGAIFYTVSARIIQAGGGVISIFFIAKYLTKVEQGYYYTFGSILAIQIFFELGLSNIITQFVAHEKAHLSWNNDTNLVGDEISLSRLASLLQFCIRWFLAIAFVLAIVLLFSGYLFFNSYGDYDSKVEWQIPWVILSILTAGNLIMSPILAFLEGLGKVREVAKIRLYQQIIILIGLFSFLALGLKLFSSPLAATMGAIIPPSIIYFGYKKELLKNIWIELREFKVDYKQEIFPYQWRIALSWMSGYFIFQLFNPVAFATEGAKVAGQMGMTLAALNGVLSLSMSWINTKVPVFSDYIAKKEYKNLDAIFNKTVVQATLICFLCLLILNMLVFSLQYYSFSIGDRFLSFFLVLLLSLSTLINQFVTALATYLRCHKQEPFLINSIVGGIMIGSSTLVFGNLYGIKGIVIGYTFCSVVIGLFWGSYIFKTKKQEWHNGK